MGATGVPVCGDPGWERANRAPDRAGRVPARLLRRLDTPSADACAGAEPGRKRIRWYAERVHHFAMSLNPAYRYEGGHFGDVAVHVLYQPGDESTWGGGVAVERTQTALAWLDRLYGPFGWPQITNVHRIEGGGTEFPMMIHDGSADQGLIVHEAGPQLHHGPPRQQRVARGLARRGVHQLPDQLVLGDDGPARATRETEAQVLQLDLDDYSRAAQPRVPRRTATSPRTTSPSTPGASCSSTSSAPSWATRRCTGSSGPSTSGGSTGTWTRPRSARWRRRSRSGTSRPSSPSGCTPPSCTTTRSAGSGAGARATGYVTRVEVVRRAPGRFPQDVAVIAQGDTRWPAPTAWPSGSGWSSGRGPGPGGGARSAGALARLEHAQQPAAARASRSSQLLVPLPGDGRLLPPLLQHPRPPRPADRRACSRWPGTTTRAGSRSASGAGATISAASSRTCSVVTASTGVGVDDDARDVDFWLRLRNPVFLRAPNLSRDAGRVQRRGPLRRHRRDRADAGGRISPSGPTWTEGLALQWVQPDDFRYLDRGYYDDVGTVELRLSPAVCDPGRAHGSSELRNTVGGGLAYNRDGLAASGRADLDPFYGRVTVEGTARRPLGARWTLGARLYAGLRRRRRRCRPSSGRSTCRARTRSSGSTNPFLRSRGSLLEGEDMHYQLPGGGGVRGIDPRVSTAAWWRSTLELERTMVARPKARLFSRVALAAFTDLAHGFGGAADAPAGRPHPLPGRRGRRAPRRAPDRRHAVRHPVRPAAVGEPARSWRRTRSPGDDEVAFRWVFSFEPGI